jgi:hypothetical protein
MVFNEKSHKAHKRNRLLGFREGGMKKFFVFLLILIILGGAAFFFGWAQLKVPPGAYGVIRSKTHGIDPRLVREGEFRWIWYKLIPANVDITVYRLNRVEHPFTVRNALPSGDAYAAFAGIAADFSYDVSADLSFSLNPESLTSLIADHHIASQDDLDALGKSLAGEIEAFVLRRLSLAGEDMGEEIEEILSAGSSPALDRAVAEQFPLVENISCLVKTAAFPDFALYRQVRELFGAFLAQQRDYLGKDLREKAETRIDSLIRFDEMERYGELLTKYPVLLQYLAIEKGALGPQDLFKAGE